MQVKKAYIDAVNKHGNNATAFFTELKKVSERLGLQFDWMCDAMWCESRFNHKAVNPYGGASGLIQFVPSTAIGLGTTVQKIRLMSNLEQLPYVEKYHRNQIKSFGKPKDWIDTYCLVFQPIWVGKPDTSTLNKERFNGSAYNGNKMLDLDKNGFITKAEFRKWANNQLPKSTFLEIVSEKKCICSQ
jgi:hypothetical protein